MMRRTDRVEKILALCDGLEALIRTVRETVADPKNRYLGEQGPLTPAQALARSKRDQKRSQRIAKINHDAMTKANEVRASMGN